MLKKPWSSGRGDSTSLSRRVYGALLSLLTLAVCATAITSYLFAREAAIVHAHHQLESVASIQANRVRDAIKQRGERLRLVASRTQLRLSTRSFTAAPNAADRARIERIINDALRSIADFRAIHVLDPAQRIIASTEPTAQGEFISAVLPLYPGSDQTTVDTLFLEGGKLRSILAGPLRVEDDLIGALVIVASAEDLVELVSDYTGLGYSGETVLARREPDGSGRFLAPLRFDANAALTRTLPAGANDVPAMIALAGHDRVLNQATSYRGHPTLAVTRHLQETGWGLAVIMDQEEAFAGLRRLGLAILGVALLVGLVGLWLARSTTLAVTRSLDRLISKAEQVSSAQWDLLPLAEGRGGGFVEIDRLETAYDEMAQRLIAQAKDLKSKSTEVSAALEAERSAMRELKSTQAQLVDKEKLAFLGESVSGITHEVNTPLGVAVLATSVVNEQCRSLHSALQDKQLTEQALQNFLSKTTDSGALIEANLKRVNDIMSGFKTVSIDQASNRTRRFLLKDYLEDVLQTLAPRTRLMPHEFILQIEGNPQVNTQPGALAQVITNLVLNAGIHGYAEGESGRVQISARQSGDRLQLCVSDDGRGMATEERDRAFDEFFTTRQNEGGSGVGLHLVKQLVTESLGGDIRLETAPGEGTRFYLDLPAELQDTPEDADQSG